jgi:protein O-GlcNAc transferase
MLGRLLRQMLREKPSAQAALLAAQAHMRAGEPEQALDACRRALQVEPDNAAALTAAGVCLRQLGRDDEAVGSFHAAIAREPALAEARLNLGNFAYLARDYDTAIAHFRVFLETQPDTPAVLNLLGAMHASAGRLDEAIACYRRVVALDLNYADVYHVLLLLLNFHPDMTPEQVHAEHRLWAQRCAERYAPAQATYPNSREPARRLRLGYVSAYFVDQPIAYYMEFIFRHHDRDSVELFLYSDTASPDAVTARLRQQASCWRDIAAMDDAQVDALIRADCIDILIDLTGHTARNRLLVFARKPAPVQATYMGYMNTTGLATMDYRITDAYVDPPGMTEALHSEELVRLPGCAYCFAPSDEHLQVNELPALKAGHVCFGSFNNYAKLSERMVAMWSRILLRNANSRLLLIADNAEDVRVRERVRARFAAHGVEAQRIEVQGRVSLAEFSALHHRVDIALDTYPYNGGTTTNHSLWMGLPVVTLAGRNPVSRCGVSLLSALGMPECVAANEEEYLAIACALAADRDKLAALRAGLRDRFRASPLYDGAGLTRNLEAAYRQMWMRWCAKQESESPQAEAGA